MHILAPAVEMHKRDPSWAEVADVAMAIDELRIWDRQIDFANIF